MPNLFDGRRKWQGFDFSMWLQRFLRIRSFRVPTNLDSKQSKKTRKSFGLNLYTFEAAMWALQKRLAQQNQNGQQGKFAYQLLVAHHSFHCSRKAQREQQWQSFCSDHSEWARNQTWKKLKYGSQNQRLEYFKASCLDSFQGGILWT